MKVRRIILIYNYFLMATWMLKQPKAYIMPGKEYFTSKLNHSLYGLKQSAHC